MKHIQNERGLSSTALLVMLGLLLAAGTGVGGYVVADSNAQERLNDKDEQIESLKKKSTAETPSVRPSGAPSGQPQSGGSAAQTATFTSANLGFTVNVPAEWVGKWRYQENGEIGISNASATFFLLNKETKYAEVVTIARIPQAKYDDAKGQGAPIANADNLIKSERGYAYVLAFPDGSPPDLKDFSYADATKKARESFKASFRLL